MATSAWDINWPTAIVACVTVAAFTTLAFAKVIPQELIEKLAIFLMGLAIPTKPLATRIRTYYSNAPPPYRVESDRPEPDERHGA